MAKTTQPAKPTPPARAFTSGGTSQAERLPVALLPEHLQLDERTVPELLAYLTHFSEQVRFYEGGTGRPESRTSWRLAQYQPLLQLATVATYPSASLAARAATELQALADAAAPAGAQRRARQRLLHRLAEQATTLARWKTEQGPGQEQRGFSSALQETLGQFVPVLRQAVRAERQLRAAGAVAGPAQLPGALTTLAAAAGDNFLAAPWDELPEETLLGAARDEWFREAPPRGPRVTKATNELRELLEEFDRALGQLARVATISLQHELQPPPELPGGSLPPEVALLTTFLRLYQHAQQELNTIPERHLDFYYTQVLGTVPRSGQPDQVFLSFTLAKGITNYTLPKGTRIGGAKTPAGQPIVFATRHEAALAAWRVAALATLFVARPTPAARVTGIYAVPPRDPAVAGGPGAPGPGRLWPLFGEDQNLSAAGRAPADARVGFAVADPVLVLQGGERLLTLGATVTPGSFEAFSRTLQEAADEENEDAESAWRVAFAVQGTGAAGWQPLVVQGVALDAGTHTVQWTLSLAAGQPALVGYDAKKHGPGFTTASPVLQFTLDSRAGVYAYSAAAALQLTGLRLDVLVSGLRQLEAANQTGPLKTSAPFYPFGARALANDYLLVGAPELTAKKLLRAHLQLTWQHLPGDFADYYAGYGQPLTNDSFQVSATYWADRAWVPAGTQALFRTGFSGKLLPVTTLEFGRLDSCGESSTGHQLRVQLTAPTWGFGDYVYPQVLASTALYNAGVVSRPAPAAATTTPANQAAAVSGRAATPAPPARLLPLPRPPFILVAQEVQLNYQAETVLHPGQPAKGDNHFYYLQPFAVIEPIAAEPLPLLPALPHEGTLLVGLSASAAGQVVELLFDLLAPTAPAYVSTALPPVQWAYLAREQWVAVEQPAYLAVPPPGFASSCRVQVHLPADLSTEHQQLPSGLCWLRATVATDAAAFGQVRALYGPLVLAERVAPALGTGTDLPLAAGQLTQPVSALPAVAQVQQPLPSFGGQLAEGPGTHRMRVSERLRHRNRALTPWDYERLLLARFPMVHSALCLPAGQAPPPWVPGRVVVVVLPQPNDLLTTPPLFGTAQLLEMTQMLQALAPTAVRLEVCNPCYERVQVRATVAYQSWPHQPALVAYSQQLQRDLNQFLSPWHQADPQQGGFHHHLTLPAVQAFIGRQPYVRAVSGLSVIKTALIEGEYRYYDSVHDPSGAGSEIGPTVPWAVLVPAPHHLLALGTAAASQPQSTGIGDLAVGESLSVACDF